MSKKKEIYKNMPLFFSKSYSFNWCKAILTVELIAYFILFLHCEQIVIIYLAVTVVVRVNVTHAAFHEDLSSLKIPCLQIHSPPHPPHTYTRSPLKQKEHSGERHYLCIMPMPVYSRTLHNMDGILYTISAKVTLYVQGGKGGFRNRERT